MRRTIPEGVATKIDSMSTREPPDKSHIPKVFEGTIKVITAYYGGGAEAGVNDTQMLVRASSIRGHLRFWWRFIYGRNYKNAQELFKEESEIFGNVDTSSTLDVLVGQPGGKPSPQPPEDNQQYALFGAKSNNQVVINKAFKFTLTLRLRSGDATKEKELLNALRFWCCFGGIGARTRRGCGAIFHEDYSDISKIDRSLLHCILLNKSTKQKAWDEALQCYQTFRQRRTKKVTVHGK